MSGPITLLLILALIFWLVKHAKRVQKICTDVRQIMKPNSVATDTSSTETNPKITPSKKDSVNWWLTVPPILIGAAAIFWSLYAPELRPADVGNLGQKYWLQILIIWCVGAGLIWLNDADEKTKKTLQKVLAGVMILLLIVFPFWAWMQSPPSAGVVQTTQRPKVPRATDPEESWIRLTLSVGEESRDFPLAPNETVRIKGSYIRIHCRYRSHKKSYRVGETPCPKSDDMLGVSIENEANGENVALLAYTPS